MVSVVHNTFSAIWVAESPPCGYCCRLSWPYDLIVFCLFLFFIYFPFLRAGQVWCRSRQTIVFVVYTLHFLQNLNLISKYCLGTYDNLPAQYTTIFHVKMLISHDNMKYFLPILLKQ